MLCYCVDPAVFSFGGSTMFVSHMLSMLSCLYGHEVLFGVIDFSCIFDPDVHLIVTILGGLQRFLCLSH
ncbi:hypothetical protein Hanom_Chr08g00728711 [Helianthus anomalus]